MYFRIVSEHHQFFSSFSEHDDLPLSLHGHEDVTFGTTSSYHHTSATYTCLHSPRKTNRTAMGSLVKKSCSGKTRTNISAIFPLSFRHLPPSFRHFFLACCPHKNTQSRTHFYTSSTLLPSFFSSVFLSCL